MDQFLRRNPNENEVNNNSKTLLENETLIFSAAQAILAARAGATR